MLRIKFKQRIHLNNAFKSAFLFKISKTFLKRLKCFKILRKDPLFWLRLFREL